MTIKVPTQDIIEHISKLCKPVPKYSQNNGVHGKCPSRYDLKMQMCPLRCPSTTSKVSIECPHYYRYYYIYNFIGYIKKQKDSITGLLQVRKLTKQYTSDIYYFFSSRFFCKGKVRRK